MQLKTSLFNFALFRKNLIRFWPIWTVYGLLWFLLVPANLLSQIQSWQESGLSPADIQYQFDRTVMGAASRSGILLAFGFGCIAALAVFSYLYQHRSAVAMHSFPLRRECLFCTNYLSGLAFFAAPLTVVLAISIIAEAACGALNLGGLLVWFTAQLGYLLFFYSFAAFCAMFTGNLFALPVFYGILSILAPGLKVLLNGAFVQFIYGYESSDGLSGLAMLCSPLVSFFYNVDMVERELEDGSVLVYMSGWGLILLYAVVGLVLTAAALAVYRQRQVETAGDVVSVALVRPVFKYGVAVCSALLGSTVLFSAFFDGYSQNSVGIMLVLMILCGGAGYFVAQMLLDKSFRVFVRHWPGFAVLSAVLAALVCMAYFDPLRVVAPIPTASQVESVSVNNFNTYPDIVLNHNDLQDPELIAQILDLHRTVVEQRAATQEKLRDAEDRVYSSPRQPESDDSGLPYADDNISYYFQLRYRLNSGRSLVRGYSILVSEEELANPDSPASKLSAILNRCNGSRDFMDGQTAQQVFQAEINIRNQTTGEYETVVLDQAEARILCQAALDDWAEGNINQTWLIYSRDYQEHTYVPTIDFRYTDKDSDGKTVTHTAWVTPLTDSRRTVAALEALGVVNEDRPLLTIWENSLLQLEKNG